MNDDCISRQAALDIIKRTNGDHAAAFSEISKLPAIDARPVVYGKWIFDSDWWDYVCTNCKGRIGNERTYDFCPYCGADMRDKKTHEPF